MDGNVDVVERLSRCVPLQKRSIALLAGNVLLGAVIAYQFGMLAFGPLDRLLDTRKWLAVGGNLVTVSLLATLALASRPPIWLPVGAILVIGFFSAVSTMVLTHGRGIIPDRLIGRRCAHRGADRRRRDLQPLAGRQAQR